MTVFIRIKLATKIIFFSFSSVVNVIDPWFYNETEDHVEVTRNQSEIHYAYSVSVRY